MSVGHFWVSEHHVALNRKQRGEAGAFRPSHTLHCQPFIQVLRHAVHPDKAAGAQSTVNVSTVQHLPFLIINCALVSCILTVLLQWEG